LYGGQDGLDTVPDGDYAGAAPLTPLEEELKRRVEERWAERKLIVARGFHHPRFHVATQEQPWPGLSSQASSLKAALATGFVTIRPDAVVSHLNFEEGTGKAHSVSYIHRIEHTRHQVRARAIILCASTIESVRILLHSTAKYRPHGLPNASDLLGRYLMDHIAITRAVFVPHVPDPTEHYPLLGGASYLIPRFRNLTGQEGSFCRGYGVWGGLQRGAFLPRFLRKVGKGAIGMIIAHGESLARHENRVTLSCEVKDAWEIPAAHIDYRWGENEKAMLADMKAQIQEMIGLLGGVCGSWADFFRVPLMAKHIRRMEEDTEHVPGQYVHEVGGARMGNSPKDSVLNAYAQMWEAPNVFATDGACWVTSAWQNPTLTEMAITARACDYLAQEMEKGHL
jgi:choline dehydrogenase-like flavoprotein